ncbi:glycosyltransferase family 4 protein [Flavobacterium sp.]|uniref:glycosyltransferase family 4 protein n=1 Tax=Flavobacterium sp. TaxID=239 RepID=UPI004047465D
MNNKLIRITTVPVSLNVLLKGQLAFMNQFYKVIGVTSYVEAQFTEIQEREKIELVNIEFTRTISPVKDLIALYKLYFFLKKEKPFIVHSHTPKAGTIGMIAAKLAGVPHRFHTIAGLPLLEHKGFKRKLLNFVEKITYSCATKIFPNSHGLKEIIVENKFTHADKLKVIANGSSNGIDCSHYDSSLFLDSEKKNLKESLGISEKDFVYIFVGRLVGDKGINELVQSFKKLSANLDNVKLLLVGPFENNLDPLKADTIEEIHTNRSIISVGIQKDVRPYFAIANALVFPSYREGFPNVVMQAGAMGLPSIVTNINGCNEIILEGQNGYIIPVKNVELLYEAMNIILNNREDYLKMSQNSRKLIKDRYEQKYVWKQLLEEYQSLGKDV